MAKKIIILKRLPNDLSFEAAFWVTVPVSRQAFYANANATSQYKDIVAGELTDIKNGVILEIVSSFNYAPGTGVASIQTDLIAKFNDLQSQITNFNPFVQYGRFWDGISWTAGGVA